MNPQEPPTLPPTALAVIMVVGNTIFGFVTAVLWFVLARFLGYSIAGIILTAMWLHKALFRLFYPFPASAYQQGSVAGSGAFELIGASTLGVLGISLYGVLGGIAAHALYLLLMESAFFPGRLQRSASLAGAAFEFLQAEGVNFLAISFMCLLFVVGVNALRPELLGHIRQESTLTQHLFLCVGYFTWITILPAIVIYRGSRGGSPRG
jgi:hypothetical protein